ncbi:MAG: hypothetical protein ABIA74_00815 [bacterium]
MHKILLQFNTIAERSRRISSNKLSEKKLLFIYRMNTTIYNSTNNINKFTARNPSTTLRTSGWVYELGFRLINKIKFTNFLILLFSLTCFPAKGHNSVDPFSKINIKSNSAICQKDKIKQNTYFFSYKENVIVTLADDSTIKADVVEIELDSSNINELTSNSKTTTTKNSDFSSVVKKINFKNNVKLNSKNKKIDANSALVDLNQKICYLSGDVFIEQIKQDKKDLPMTTKCDKATLSFETEEINLVGNKENPVNTIIEIDKTLIKKSKKKRKRRII